MRTKLHDVCNRSKKRWKPSKIVSASPSATEYAISLGFKVLEKKPTGLSSLLGVATIPVPDASVWRTKGSFDRGYQSTAEVFSFFRVLKASQEAWFSGNASCFCAANRGAFLFE